MLTMFFTLEITIKHYLLIHIRTIFEFFVSYYNNVYLRYRHHYENDGSKKTWRLYIWKLLPANAILIQQKVIIQWNIRKKDL